MKDYSRDIAYIALIIAAIFFAVDGHLFFERLETPYVREAGLICHPSNIPYCVTLN